MNVTEAINVVLQALELGRKSAVYSFDDSALISQAIHILENVKAAQPQNTEKTEQPQKQSKTK